MGIWWVACWYIEKVLRQEQIQFSSAGSALWSLSQLHGTRVNFGFHIPAYMWEGGEACKYCGWILIPLPPFFFFPLYLCSPLWNSSPVYHIIEHLNFSSHFHDLLRKMIPVTGRRWEGISLLTRKNTFFFLSSCCPTARGQHSLASKVPIKTVPRNCLQA